MRQIVYVSSATAGFDKAALLELLTQARTRNVELNVSGILLYQGGNIMQVLEGEADVLADLSARIERDSRHGGFMTLLNREIECRQFAAWSMAFRDIGDTALADIDGFDTYLNEINDAIQAEKGDAKVNTLLATFKRGMR